MVTSQQQFCVRWNSYHSNLQSAFPKLLTSEHFVDVTLACDNGLIKCHKVVLSACSSYFENILIQNPCQHPTIVLKDMKCTEVQALVDFMYKGEVNVSQEELPNLLKAAECLQIRGLSGSEQCLNQMYIRNQTAGTTGGAVSPSPPCPPLTPVMAQQAAAAACPASTSTPLSTNTSACNNTNMLNNSGLVPVAAVCTVGDKLNKGGECGGGDSKRRKDIVDKKSDNNSATSSADNDDRNEDIQDELEFEEYKIKSESMKEEEMTYNDEDLDMDYLDADDDTSETNIPGTSSGLQQSGANREPTNLIKPHTLLKRQGIARTTRKRCKSCYKNIQGTSKTKTIYAKKVSTYCDNCPNKPTMCLECFNRNH